MELLEIWTPLLESVAANHQAFPSVLVTNIVNTLLYGKQGTVDDELSRKDRSYEQCLARWAAFVVEKWGASLNAATSQVSKIFLAREDVVAMLLTALGSSEVSDSSEKAR